MSSLASGDLVAFAVSSWSEGACLFAVAIVGAVIAAVKAKTKYRFAAAAVVAVLIIIAFIGLKAGVT
jgi:predicted Co/Zn/Cd cation transporter (cation efflux family)